MVLIIRRKNLSSSNNFNGTRHLPEAKREAARPVRHAGEQENTDHVILPVFVFLIQCKETVMTVKIPHSPIRSHEDGLRSASNYTVTGIDYPLSLSLLNVPRSSRRFKQC
jgi:hypothetical protein